MIDRKLSPLGQVEQHLQSKQYSEALSLLDQIEASRLTGRNRGLYCLYRTEASLHCGDYSFVEIDKAIEIFRFHQETPLFARAKLLKGWWLIAVGRHAESKEVLLEAYTNFLRCNDAEGCCRALNRLAQAHFQTGEVDLAISNIERCVDLSKDAKGDDQSSGSQFAEINLAYLLFMAGKISRANSVYCQLRSVIPKQEDRDKCVYWMMSAIPHAMCGQFVNAHEALAKADSLADSFKREQALILENRGWVLLMQGRYAEAQQTLAHGLNLSENTAPESALVSQIKRLLADCYVATGRFDSALQTATEALTVAEKIGQKVEIAACWRVFAQVAVYDGKTSEAREWFKKAIDLFNQISSRYELAVTRYLAACSGVLEKTESLAMLYLAREYFESEQVVPYIAKVQSALLQMQRFIPPVGQIKSRNGTTPVQIITANRAMLSTLELARNVAPTAMTVLITGETGTGKDLLARYIYEHSECSGEFVSQNVTTLPASMVEAELFGHRKGAFTGADRDRQGLIRQAEHGTLFLNEIGEASVELQAKLLEVLETRRVRRVGEDKDQPVEFRLIAATNADLRECARSGKFRPDLYHRLNQATITLLPLRDRLDDIAPLVRHFLASLGCTNGDTSEMAELIKVLSSHSWPGNVRELEHTIRRLWLVHNGSLARMIKAVADDIVDEQDDRLLSVLTDCGGNQRKAARRLGIGESTLRYRLKKQQD